MTIGGIYKYKLDFAKKLKNIGLYTWDKSFIVTRFTDYHVYFRMENGVFEWMESIDCFEEMFDMQGELNEKETLKQTDMPME